MARTRIHHSNRDVALPYHTGAVVALNLQYLYSAVFVSALVSPWSPYSIIII